VKRTGTTEREYEREYEYGLLLRTAVYR